MKNFERFVYIESRERRERVEKRFSLLRGGLVLIWFEEKYVKERMS